MQRLVFAVLLVVTSLLFAPDVSAHGGGLDRYGCHNDRRNGGYHCHRGGVGDGSSSSGRRSSSIAQGLYGPSRQTSDANLVRAAQTLLNHLGCDAGTVDGAVGLQTSAAVTRFNRVNSDGASSLAIDSALVLRLSTAVTDGQSCAAD